ncbi:tetratricopeptide repeat protein [Rheinheimera sediminis]|uniref:tetratricopeptide repeat protein n=1 Tax=Rheinheimera sp. YQF-1 TaxID=2499626 RepID=UPI000FD7E972|nr:tetratricopeptide repeat protein [Rheinheimera sp. YQF-1]RVT48237.1 tetratricopeptide repeat protein [Rheinheimera sp. YQF-1]
MLRNYLSRVVILSSVLLCTWPLEASEHYSDHELFCFSLPKNTDCLLELQRQLQQQPTGSKSWYKLESYLLDYYYDKIDFTSLKLQAEMLLQRQDVPSVVLAQVYFYYAKTMMHFNQPGQAEAYGLKAAHLVTELYKSFGNPLRLVELANLQKALGQNELAVQTLSEAEHRAGNSQDPIFWFELNSNKALISDSAESFEESLLYRQRAVTAILPTAHNLKIVVALGNLARTEQLLGRYQAALEHYQQSLAYMSKNTDPHNWSIYHVRLAEIAIQLSDQRLSSQYMQQIDSGLLGQTHLVVYQQLQQQLAQYHKKKPAGI